MKKVLIVGGGGREHALGWRLLRDSSPPRLWFAPGNAGTMPLGKNLEIAAEAVDGIVAWARENRPDLVIVGPEAPLCAGLADLLALEEIPVFGPGRAGARIEGSKDFAKSLMREAGVPTAEATTCSRLDDALRVVDSMTPPLVVKADGLASGKGVFVCESRQEARQALESMMGQRCFGSSGDVVVLEQYLEGREVSLLALTDGKGAFVLPPAQDHKRALDRDLGPNTGGMGAFSPTPVFDQAMVARAHEEVIMPVISALAARGVAYRGVLYAGLMLTADGPMVLEFNCRFGDPETQVVLPRLRGDLLPLLEACALGGLEQMAAPAVREDACAGVVMASGGYPGEYRQGLPVTGLDEASRLPGVEIFHAGTKTDREGRVVTAGGRVLNVVALGGDMRQALSRAYRAVETIRFEDAFWRRDIARSRTGPEDGLPG